MQNKHLVIDKLSSSQNNKSQVPNQLLAKQLVDGDHQDDICVLVENLTHKDKKIQADCIKVLYEIGYLNPNLISQYVDEFLKLLTNKNNRLVWGGMIALFTTAKINDDELFGHRELIKSIIDKGSTITADNGIKLLSIVASKNESHNSELFTYLIEKLKTCRPNSVAQYSESIALAVNKVNKQIFIGILEYRLNHTSKPQQTRIIKLIKKYGK